LRYPNSHDIILKDEKLNSISNEKSLEKSKSPERSSSPKPINLEERDEWSYNQKNKG